jgi:hypothetical protein
MNKSGSDIDDALNSLRTLFLSSLAVLALWFLAWPAAVLKLQQFDQARDLEAWVLLKELVRNPELDVFGAKPDDPIKDFTVERHSQVPQGSDYDETIKLAVASVWPHERTYPVTLIPETYFRAGHEGENITKYARIYKVRADTDDLPLSEYLAVFVQIDAGRDERFIVAADDAAFRTDSQRGLRLIVVAARSRFQPRYWPFVAGRLGNYGFLGKPSDLPATDQALTKLYSASDPRVPASGVQIFGLQLSIAVFFSGAGILLAAIAFACFGPIVRLRGTAASSTQAWIMSLPRPPGVIGWLLEGCVAVIGVTWALAPLVILVLQLRSGVAAQSGNVWLWRIGAAGLTFSTVVFLIAAMELRHLRLGNRTSSRS